MIKSIEADDIKIFKELKQDVYDSRISGEMNVKFHVLKFGTHPMYMKERGLMNFDIFRETNIYSDGYYFQGNMCSNTHIQKCLEYCYKYKRFPDNFELKNMEQLKEILSRLSIITPIFRMTDHGWRPEYFEDYKYLEAINIFLDAITERTKIKTLNANEPIYLRRTSDPFNRYIILMIMFTIYIGKDMFQNDFIHGITSSDLEVIISVEYLTLDDNLKTLITPCIIYEYITDIRIGVVDLAFGHFVVNDQSHDMGLWMLHILTCLDKYLNESPGIISMMSYLKFGDHPISSFWCGELNHLLKSVYEVVDSMKFIYDFDDTFMFKLNWMFDMSKDNISMTPLHATHILNNFDEFVNLKYCDHSIDGNRLKKLWQKYKFNVQPNENDPIVYKNEQDGKYYIKTDTLKSDPMTDFDYAVNYLKYCIAEHDIPHVLGVYTLNDIKDEYIIDAFCSSMITTYEINNYPSSVINECKCKGLIRSTIITSAISYSIVIISFVGRNIIKETRTMTERHRVYDINRNIMFELNVFDLYKFVTCQELDIEHEDFVELSERKFGHEYDELHDLKVTYLRIIMNEDIVHRKIMFLFCSYYIKNEKEFVNHRYVKYSELINVKKLLAFILKYNLFLEIEEHKIESYKDTIGTLINQKITYAEFVLLFSEWN